MFFFGKLLHKVFGFGWQMCACCCDSLSQYLVHNHYQKRYSTRVRPSSGAFAPPQEPLLLLRSLCSSSGAFASPQEPLLLLRSLCSSSGAFAPPQEPLFLLRSLCFSSGAFARPQSDPFAGISFQGPQLENHYATPKPPEYQEFVCKPAEV
nr:PREDICTED: uncharacterized protein LOC109033508 [Bemisia tabaci]